MLWPPLRLPVAPSLTCYESVEWPMLQRAVLSLIDAQACMPLALEPLHRAVRACCCCGLEQRLQADLEALLVRHATDIARLLSPAPGWTRVDEAALLEALRPVGAVFSFLDREHLDGQLLPRLVEYLLPSVEQTVAEEPVSPPTETLSELSPGNVDEGLLPETGDLPETSDLPETGDVPETSGMPETSHLPETSDMQSCPSEPDAAAAAPTEASITPSKQAVELEEVQRAPSSKEVAGAKGRTRNAPASGLPPREPSKRQRVQSERTRR